MKGLEITLPSNTRGCSNTPVLTSKSPNVVFGMRRCATCAKSFDGGSFVESSRCHEPRLELLDGSRMYVLAVFLGFGCIECLVARLSKLAFGSVTYSPELQKAARRMYLLWQA
jgi:hypothetical protein